MKLSMLSILFFSLIHTYPPHEYHVYFIREMAPLYNQAYTGDCTLHIDEYDPAIMWKQRTYWRNYRSDQSGLVRGEKIGEVKFKMNGMVCPGYIMKNGDATDAAIGTPIYTVKGYAEGYRLFVGEDLYEVRKIPGARIIGDFNDIGGKVKKITIQYPIENSPSIDLSGEDTQLFVKRYLQLKHVPSSKIYQQSSVYSQPYFLKFTLQDHSSFIESFRLEENAFTLGYGTEDTKRILLPYLQKLPPLPADNR
ncbi:hypothetical protein [Brevibacillus migulae]|uniref:hypothetical protein n=1 Tax=Brevibacillus migulae TaxID=1644114 RepID=UPI00106DEE66|nr:hypothetical protein [Brevibacillus migulae]